MSGFCWGLRRGPFRWLLMALLVTAWVGVASAQAPQVVQVEEDWELVVGEPDPQTSAPQVLCTISPFSHVDSFHATLELNHHDIPSFAPGGLQFEIWNGEVPLHERKFPNQALLAQPAGETIRWTQRMEFSEGTLRFEVVNGSSTTWGNFGGQGYLKGSVDTCMADLNAYSPEVSVANSGVGYASNRVQSLTLTAVRLTLSTGEVIEDNTARVVHSQE